jgi:hypothetical protein
MVGPSFHVIWIPGSAFLYVEAPIPDALIKVYHRESPAGKKIQTIFDIFSGKLGKR